jgi:hypothetical protein
MEKIKRSWDVISSEKKKIIIEEMIFFLEKKEIKIKV